MAPTPRQEIWLPLGPAASAAGVCKRSVQRWAAANSIRVQVVEGRRLAEVGEVAAYAGRPRAGGGGDVRRGGDTLSPAASPPTDVLAALEARLAVVEAMVGLRPPSPPTSSGTSEGTKGSPTTEVSQRP